MFTSHPPAKSSVYGSLCQWARKATTSFAELRFMHSPQHDEPLDEGEELIYRLTHWPELPCASRTADVLRTLSVMSTRPVNRRWILATTKLRPQDVDHLLRRLVEQDAVQVIDPSTLPLTVAPRAHPASTAGLFPQLRLH